MTGSSRHDWRKSSYSNGSGGMCVEVAHTGNGVMVRDSKDPDGPQLCFTAGEWAAFLGGVAGGEFDLPDWPAASIGR